MGRIQSSVGLISGIPVQDTIDKLMALAAQPRVALEGRVAKLKAQKLAVTELTALIIGVQGEARSVLDGAREAGVNEARLRFAANSMEAGEILSREVRPGDVVLVKGSRGVKLENVLGALRSTFSSVEA